MTQLKILLAAPALLALAATSAIAEVNQPQEIIDRPRTTPASQITVGGDLLILKIKDIDAGIGLAVGGAYGVNEKLEVGATYGFSLKEFEAKGTALVHAAYGLVDGNLSAAADLSIGYDLLGEAITPLGLGAEVQFKVNDKLAIYTPGTQLSIGLEEPNSISLGLPVSVGFQVNSQIFAHVDTHLATIALKDAGDTTVFGADYIPAAVGAYFSPSNTMDFGATLDLFDLKNAGDIIGVTASARLHM